ncbi:hypothetical protein PIB30_031266 [Stylosanthes scabra]|uniref:Uncharacterized protein n=1 Tax=Stylosanthes scabra TaxID=79078 RepID=A0ABU6XDI6_9FABA|nr:hypothetical protein [Stylosanthes scabra]
MIDGVIMGLEYPSLDCYGVRPQSPPETTIITSSRFFFNNKLALSKLLSVASSPSSCLHFRWFYKGSSSRLCLAMSLKRALVSILWLLHGIYKR